MSEQRSKSRHENAGKAIKRVRMKEAIDKKTEGSNVGRTFVASPCLL